MDRTPDFSEYGDKSLEHLIRVKDERIKRLRAEVDRDLAIRFYAHKECIERKSKRGDYGTVVS